MYTFVLTTQRMVTVDAENLKEAEEKLHCGEYTFSSERITDHVKLIKKEND